MTARDELIARVEARLTRAEHVESRSAEVPVSDLRAILALATAPDGWPTEEQIRGCCTAFLSGPTDMCAETEEGEIHEAMRDAIRTLNHPTPAEVEALTAARASFPSIDRAGPIATAPEPDVATEEECRDIPKCAHGVIIFGDRVRCAECDAEATPPEPDWIPWAGQDWACPVAPHTRVDLRFVGGDEHHNVDGYVWSWKRVTAYRLVTP